MGPLRDGAWWGALDWPLIALWLPVLRCSCHYDTVHPEASIGAEQKPGGVLLNLCHRDLSKCLVFIRHQPLGISL